MCELAGPMGWREEPVCSISDSLRHCHGVVATQYAAQPKLFVSRDLSRRSRGKCCEAATGSGTALTIRAGEPIHLYW